MVEYYLAGCLETAYDVIQSESRSVPQTCTGVARGLLSILSAGRRSGTLFKSLEVLSEFK